jgi:hypothetical protein
VLALAIFSAAFAIFSYINFSGVVCVGIQFVESFIQGEKINSNQKWAGISLVSSLLGDLEVLTKNNSTQAESINNNKNSYLNSYGKWNDFKNENRDKYSEKYFDIISPKMNLDESEVKQYSIAPNYTYKWKEILNEI